MMELRGACKANYCACVKNFVRPACAFVSLVPPPATSEKMMNAA